MRRLAILLVMGPATLAVAGLAGGGAWAWRSGEAQTMAARAERATVEASAEAGMRLRQITVEGRVHTRASEILAALDLPQGAPLLALDPVAARDRLESLPWVKEANVERRLPDIVHLRLTERTPIALWERREGDFALVDADGVAITDDIAPFADLPVISGPGAPEAAADLFTMLGGEPGLGNRVRAAVRVGQRRWNLWFHGLGKTGLEVRLPEVGAQRALARLARLDEEQALLDRDLKVIDMRLPDRLIVRLHDDGDGDGDGGTAIPGYSGGGVPLPLRGPARDA